MASSDIISLGDLTITTAQTYTGDWTTASLDDMLSCLISLRFVYGSGGTSGKVYVQTTPDDGVTVCDVICMTFTTSSKQRLWNLSALTPKTIAVTPGDGELTDDTALDGILGSKMRVKIVTVGTYAGSTILSSRLYRKRT